MKHIFSTLALICYLAVGCASSPTVRPGLSTTTPVTQNRDHAIYDWQQRHAEILEYNRTHHPDVVILGDSIIHYWGGEPAAPKAWAQSAWENAFFGVAVENLGFGWDRTENVLWRIGHGELDGIKPKAVVLMIGTNNSASDSAAAIVKGVTAIVEVIRSKQPQANILLLAVFPRGEKASPNPARDKLKQVNSALAKLDDGQHIHFLDIGGKFLQPDGSLTKAISPDFLHLSPAGYQIWADAIAPQLTALMK